LRQYFYGDFYPLTESANNTRDDVWLAYQLNRPEQRVVLILAFRRNTNNNETIKIKLSGLEDNTVYEVCYEDYEIIIRKSGHELMEGFDITIPQKPSSLMISYRSV
jgi:alpha-galactosidase